MQNRIKENSNNIILLGFAPTAELGAWEYVSPWFADISFIINFFPLKIYWAPLSVSHKFILSPNSQLLPQFPNSKQWQRTLGA